MNIFKKKKNICIRISFFLQCEEDPILNHLGMLYLYTRKFTFSLHL